MTNYNFYQFRLKFRDTVKLVYKGHLREPENMPFMSDCLLYTGY